MARDRLGLRANSGATHRRRERVIVQQGVGRQYRNPSAIERAVTASASFAPAWLRRALKGVFASALAKLPGDHLSCRLPGGETFRIDPEFRQLAWNPEEYNALKAAVRPGATVLDIGANVGAYSLLFATWVGDAGRVYAFEPAPGARAGLARHLALNGLADRVIVQPEAVSDRISLSPFMGAGASGDNRLLKAKGRGAITVRTVTIDDFCTASGIKPDVIKIDVEGGELAALRGARLTITERPALALFVELHPAVWRALGYSRSDLEQELATQGLRVDPLPGIADPWAVEGVCARVRRIDADPDR